jgi:hypothetical protein
MGGRARAREAWRGGLGFGGRAWLGIGFCGGGDGEAGGMGGGGGFGLGLEGSQRAASLSPLSGGTPTSGRDRGTVPVNRLARALDLHRWVSRWGYVDGWDERVGGCQRQLPRGTDQKLLCSGC